MAYYLSRERTQDVVNSYRLYQQYLQQHKHLFPPGAFALGTAEWYQNPRHHCCPHDGRLESLAISQASAYDPRQATTLRIRLIGAYQDGFIEFFYPQVFKHTILGSSSAAHPGDWLYDEFRLSGEGNLIHEIEWSGFTGGEDTRWMIEASDVEFRWFRELTSRVQ